MSLLCCWDMPSYTVNPPFMTNAVGLPLPEIAPYGFVRLRGGADANALRRATALLDFRLVQRAARPGLKPADVGGAGRRDGMIIIGKRMSER